MGLSANDVITASDFIALKARVKAECKRRKYNGSVATYGGADYDYTFKPTADTVPLIEHFNKIIVPLNKIIDTGKSKVKSGNLIDALNNIDSSLTALEKISATAASSGCKSSCTGLCQGTCTTGCTGCTGTCKGGCGSGCSSNCSTACTTGCKNTCKSTCTGTCDGGCVNGCGEYCESGCEGNCKGTCTATCAVTCIGYCKGAVENDPAQ